ncbi:MAG: HEAT repeat domain-containing protein [Deltaproteobacteria bacterium]|nr:HEAT repeat domain-containing protein [Deltaproteobacteria bacterium]
MRTMNRQRVALELFREATVWHDSARGVTALRLPARSADTVLVRRELGGAFREFLTVATAGEAGGTSRLLFSPDKPLLRLTETPAGAQLWVAEGNQLIASGLLTVTEPDHVSALAIGAHFELLDCQVAPQLLTPRDPTLEALVVMTLQRMLVGKMSYTSIDAMGQLGWPHFAEALQQAFAESAPDARGGCGRRLAVALGKTGAKAAVLQLLQWMSDHPPAVAPSFFVRQRNPPATVRAACAAALQRLGETDAAVAGVRGILLSRDVLDSEYLHIGWPQNVGDYLLNELLPAGFDLTALHGELAAALARPTPKDPFGGETGRFDAARASLALALGDATAIRRSWTAQLQQPCNPITEYLLDLLAHATPALALPLLTPFLSSSVFIRHRLAALRAITKVADPEAVPALRAVLATEAMESGVRSELAGALWACGDVATAESVLRAVQAQTTNKWARIHAAALIGTYGDPAVARTKLEPWIAEAHPRGYSVVPVGADRTKTEAEAQREHDRLRAQALQAYQQIRDPAIIPSLRAVLEEPASQPTDELKVEAALALGLQL